MPKKKTEEKKKEEVPKEEEKLLVPLEHYIKSSAHIGTRAVSPDMRKYMYRRKADGVAVLNTNKVDEKIAVAASFLAEFETKDIIFCCKRDGCEKIIKKFNEVTGIKSFAKYPVGAITNPDLDNFFEPKLVFISDPWVDKNALNDAIKCHIPVIALCGTNNLTKNIDLVVPCNNKSPKSLGLILYIIAKLFIEKKKIKHEINPDDFYNLEEPTLAKKKIMGLDEARKLIKKKLAAMKKERPKKETPKEPEKKEEPKEEKLKEETPKKRGRPKKEKSS
ncbi:MAG: 30S ribosomal protein S2 [archaeon]